MLHAILTYIPLLLGAYLFTFCCQELRGEWRSDVRWAAARSGGFLLLLGFVFTQGLKGQVLDANFIGNVTLHALLSLCIVASSLNTDWHPWWRPALTGALVVLTGTVWGVNL